MRPSRLAQPRPVARERPDRGNPDRTSARPLLLAPARLEELPGPPGLAARRSSRAGPAPPRAGRSADILRSGGHCRHRRTRTRPPGCPPGGESSNVTLIGKPVATAEPVSPLARQKGRSIDGGDLGQRALAVALGQLVALEREDRVVIDPARRASVGSRRSRAGPAPSTRSETTRDAGSALDDPAHRRAGARLGRPSCAASLIGSSCEPPTNRLAWAPPRVLKLRWNVPGCFGSPEAAM